MNKNIKRLIKEAGISVLYEYDGYDGHAAVCNLDDVEKLTDLVLQECRGVLERLYHRVPLELCGVLLTLDEEIQRHFND